MRGMRLPSFPLSVSVSVLLVILSVLQNSNFSEGFLRRYFNVTRYPRISMPLLLSPDQHHQQQQQNENQQEQQQQLLTKQLPATQGFPQPLLGYQENLTRCYGELGCLELSNEWYDLTNRPMNWFPQDRKIVNATFSIYNPSSSEKFVLVQPNRTELLDQNFNPQKPIKFVAHGYLDGSDFLTWGTRLCQALSILSDHQQFNIFLVHWSLGSLPLYIQATANTRLVGLEIAFFFKFLQSEFQAQVEECHCIGHSLGAHVCGYAGEKMNGTLGRITGLDPAGPSFQNLPPKVRLDPTDAKFVDVIHTDGSWNILEGLGMIQPCGHMDFYPNDGKEQPGCEMSQLPKKIYYSMTHEVLEGEYIGCSHHRAIHYFIESILNRHQYVSHICQDYKSYLQGKCWDCGNEGSNCAMLGMDSIKYNIGNRKLLKFYLTTAPSSPFFVRHYRVNIQLAWPAQALADDRIVGQLKISLLGMKRSLLDINLNPIVNETIRSEKNLTFMLQSPKTLGSIKQVIIEWESPGGFYGNLGHITCSWLFIGCSHHLFIDKIIVSDMDVMVQLPRSRSRSTKRKENIFCSEGGSGFKGIPMGSTALFHRQC